MMDTKQYLTSVRYLEQRLRMKQIHAESMQKDLNYGGILPSTYIRQVMAEIRNETIQAEENFLKAKQEAMDLLNQIHPESAMILTQRYWEKKTMPAIANGLYLSERQAYRRLNSAIAEFQAVLDSSEIQKAG